MEDKITLEVGVSDGFDTEKIIQKYKLPHYGFEPVPYMRNILNKKFKTNPNVHITEAAIDLTDGMKNFNLSNPNGTFTDGTNRKIHPYGCSSLHEFSDALAIKWPGRPDFQVVEKIKVKTMRLDTFFEENNFKGEIEFMHCDAQGSDINVLKSMGKYLRCVKHGKIEVALVTELYKDTGNNVKNAVTFLRDNGFNCNEPTGRHSHEADIVFTRRR